MSTSPPEQTVIVTTKNTASLTLGITALVVGVLSLLVGWIPFFGLIALPVAVIGLLLAGIGFGIAVVKGGKGIGMPVLGGLICCGAFVLPILTTGGMSALFSKAKDEASRQIASQKAERQRSETNATVTADKKEDAEAKTKSEYIREHVVLYDVEARYMDSRLDGKVPGVLFKLRNKGDRQLDLVKVTVLFKEAAGGVIHEEDFSPVLVTRYSFSGDNKPLKPGYVWQMEKGKFYPAKSVPSEWKEGSVEARVSDIKFSDLAASTE